MGAPVLRKSKQQYVQYVRDVHFAQRTREFRLQGALESRRRRRRRERTLRRRHRLREMTIARATARAHATMQ